MATRDPSLDLFHLWAPQGSPWPCCYPKGDTIPKSLCGGRMRSCQSSLCFPKMQEEGPSLNQLTVSGNTDKLLAADHH